MKGGSYHCLVNLNGLSRKMLINSTKNEQFTLKVSTFYFNKRIHRLYYDIRLI